MILNDEHKKYLNEYHFTITHCWGEDVPQKVLQSYSLPVNATGRRAMIQE